MKTEEQIKNLLPSQLWFDRYNHNINDAEIVGLVYKEKTPEQKLNGELRESTIERAFIWGRTEEEYTFWSDVNYQICRWYNAE